MNSSGIVGKRLGSGKKAELGGERQNYMLKDRSSKNLAQVCWVEGYRDDVCMQGAVGFQWRACLKVLDKRTRKGLRDGQITVLPFSKSLQKQSKLFAGVHRRSIASMLDLQQG